MTARPDTDTFKSAQILVESGLSVIPVRADGSKRPALDEWKRYQSKIPSIQKQRTWFQNGNGLAIIGGRVSGNLEILDFDKPELFKPWADFVKSRGGDSLLKRLVVVNTAGGGWHVYYRCSEIEGNQKLAMGLEDGKPKTWIETRGEGGYVLAPGCPPACHPSGNQYQIMRGSLTQIQQITPDERSLLLQAARELNEFEHPEPREVVTGGPAGQGRPGDDYNRRGDWTELLERHGWILDDRHEETQYFRQPGSKKQKGHCVSVNHGGSGLLYVFCSNAHPFELQRGYSLFAAYALLEHTGDFSAAAKALSQAGYGELPLKSHFAQAERKWPDPPDEAAYYGLAGDIVRAIEPHTESDPVAILAQTLVAFGNVVGRQPHFYVESDRHGMNEFVVVVGNTAKSRKGTSWGRVRELFHQAEPVWTETRVLAGLSSGEGLISAVRDPISKQVPIKDKDKGRIIDYQMEITDPGVDDKRLLVVETEYANVLKMSLREGNILSITLRVAWDTGKLSNLVKNSPNQATDAHISMIGHITKTELLRYLSETESANGYANRHLFLCARRSKLLPRGGRQVDIAPLVIRLRRAIEFARSTGEIRMDEEAWGMWETVDPDLTRDIPGLLGAVTSRAEAHVRRLASIYALLDLSDTVRRPHLEAALALWTYPEVSARHIFGDATGDPVVDAILAALRTAALTGMNRSEISGLFSRHQSSAQIERALQLLQQQGHARCERVDTEGRPAEVWFAMGCEISEISEGR